MKNMKTSLFWVIFLLALGSVAHAQITPSGDAYTTTASPTKNFGTSTLLDVESASQNTYIQFDLSSLPSGYTGANISKATLKLYVNAVTTAGSFNVDFVDGTWSEKTITADLSPALGTTIVSTVSLTTANVHDYVIIDITSALTAWLDGTQTNDGIALVGNSPLNASFDSKENTATSHPPELDIVFAGGGTITGVTTAKGSGLTGGGTTGTLNLALTNACSANQVLQWSGSAWACAAVGTGTITGVTAGTGLLGGGTGGNVTLNLDTTKVPLLNSANIFSGNQTVKGNVSAGSYEIAGTQVVSISPGSFSLYLGQSAGQGAGANNTGSQNTSAGYQTLFLNTSGNNDTAFGTDALYNNTTGSLNAAAGSFSLNANTTGTGNTASGFESLLDNTSGGYNAAAGYSALHSNTTGGYNTAHGAAALQNNTTGSSNTALGDLALSPNTTGSGNVGVGTVAGGASPNSALTTGSLDTYLGSYTSSGTQTNLSNATAIGAYAEVTENNAIVLGSISGVNGATSSVNVGIGTTAPAYMLDVHGTANFMGLITFAPNQTFPGIGTISAVNPGFGLLGGGNSGAVTLSVDISKVMTGVSAGTGLVGGGTGGTPTVSVDPTQVPLLNAANNTFTGNLNILNNANYQPLSVQSSSTFGTWLNLINTSTSGKQWSILSAGGANAEGAGNLAVTNFTGNSNIYLEGNVKANTLSVNNDTPMSSNPHMAFSGFLPGNLGNAPLGGFFIPDRNITITRVTASENSAGSNCGSASVVQLYSVPSFNVITQLDLGQNQSFADSGPLTVAVSAGTSIGISGLAATNCTPIIGTSPSDVFVNVQYVMQ